MKKMIFGLLLCLPLAAHADAPTPDAVKAFKEIASKADNKHWKEQEIRLDKSAKQIASNTKAWKNRASKNNPQVLAAMMEQDDQEMKKWEAENFDSK
jgi:hypothetical protein